MTYALWKLQCFTIKCTNHTFDGVASPEYFLFENRLMKNRSLLLLALVVYLFSWNVVNVKHLWFLPICAIRVNEKDLRLNTLIYSFKYNRVGIFLFDDKLLKIECLIILIFLHMLYSFSKLMNLGNQTGPFPFKTIILIL